MTTVAPTSVVLEPTPQVIGILEEFLAELEMGARPSPEELAARCPEMAEPLKACLASLAFLHDAAPSLRGSGRPLQPASLQHLAELGPLGDFRLVREVGRGGMGVVYEAEQISLRRRVALKVLPFAAALDARQLQRFKNEAHAAATLHHTNIVPVFGVGSEGSTHYYAMQYIEGQTLAEIIGLLRGGKAPGPAGFGAEPSDRHAAASSPKRPGAEPSPAASPRRFRAAAMLGMQAALALEHAHQLGVVHRDIKPANLLVESFSPSALEETGAGADGVRLWVTDFGLAQFRHGPAGLTVTGELVGTLRFMSPEQALAQPTGVDHRTDIYSLGATLYELLTLEPAFAGRDRQELLRQIAIEEPKPVRRVNKAIPLDLETIVLKAMAKNPAERYATARELADDLRRFLRDEPILARRSTLLQRARRWARRHRPVMVSAAVALLAALTVLAGSVGWIMRDQAARQAKMTAGVQAALDEAQRFQKEGLWPQAQAAAKRAEVLLQDGTAEPALAERVKSLLRNLAEQEADVRLVARLDAIRLRQADVNDNQFVIDRSRVEYQQAFGTYGLRMEATTPDQAAAVLRRRPPSVRSTLLAALDHWSILARSEKAPEASWLKQVLSVADSDPWRQGVRAAREKNDRQEMEKLAREVDTAVQPPEALFVLELGLAERGATQAALALLRSAQEAFPGDFWINHDLGMALGRCHPPQNEEAIRFLTAAVALRTDSAGLRLDLGKTLARAGRLDEAIVACRQAIGLKPDFSMAHLDLGLRLAEKGHLDEAVAALRRASQLKPDYGHAYYDLGLFLYRMGRVDEALAPLRRAVDLMPDDSVAHSQLGRVLAEKGLLDEAAAAWRRASQLKPDDGDAYYNLGTSLFKMGRLDEALAPLRRAVGLMPDHAESHCNLGLALRKQGEFTEALIALERGHELGSRRKDWRYPSAQWVRECRRKIDLDGRLAAVLRGEEQPADAVERDEYAHLCYEKKRYVAAARFFSQVLTADPKSADDLQNSHRYQAACAAALAGCGRGGDAVQLDRQELARWRNQALDWLRAELKAYGELLPVSNPEERQRLQEWLRGWQSEPALAGLRDATAVAHLSAAEQESCKQLWAEVQAWLAKAGTAEFRGPDSPVP
jgi:eukaryotic-like serine/threonine-protein kinase